MNSYDASDTPEVDEVLPGDVERDDGDHPSESSRREIARQIALEALRADRHVLEISAATAFRDFSCARPA
ncbi:hypothetical protein ACGFNV_23275 [Streptomyces sp. NPDC048751]|uniref:hypothetical protein n=1 Tax=Streptomyces sp. NPDC048751 TaxID=3365591 RepID=UPI003710C108